MLTRENYFSPENNLKYMGSSQFKKFMECQAGALAELRGEYQRDSSVALMVGSYVDSHFENTLDLFKSQNPDIFKRDGSLKSEYLGANNCIQRAERDPLFMEYMSGEKQVIRTGFIGGVEFKIRIDVLHLDKIVDLKCMRDFKTIYKDGERKSFVEAWGYDIQAAIYQAVTFYSDYGEYPGATLGCAKQEKLPFYIAGITKEKEPDLAILEIPQSVMDNQIAVVEHFARDFHAIKLGLVEPTRCEKCDYCKSTKILTRAIDYRLLGDELIMEDEDDE